MSAWLERLQQLSLVVFLISSMLAMGLNVSLAQIITPLRDVRLVLRVLALNFLLAPLLAWLVTRVIPLQPGHAAGLLLLGAAAGAPFLPIVVKAARGDVALSIALVVLLTAGTIVFLPLALPHLIPGVETDPWDIARPLLLLIVLPLIVGMGFAAAWRGPAGRAAPILGKIGNVALLLLFALIVSLNGRVLVGLVGDGAIAAAVLYIVSLFALSWLLGGRVAAKRGALALTSISRNFGAAFVPAGTMRDPSVALMLIVCVVVDLVLVFLLAGWLRRRGGAN